jgi:hypothetical protein
VVLRWSKYDLRSVELAGRLGELDQEAAGTG